MTADTIPTPVVAGRQRRAWGDIAFHALTMLFALLVLLVVVCSLVQVCLRVDNLT